MPNPYPTALRDRVVRAYEAGEQSGAEVAADFGIGVATLERWLRRQRETGTLDPLAKAGGRKSPVDVAVLRRVVTERPDRTSDELTREYNREVPAARRVHRSSILRALRRLGYVFKKNARAQPNSTARTCRPSGLRSSRGRPA